jgi:peptide/nickel transport system permease protein
LIIAVCLVVAACGSLIIRTNPLRTNPAAISLRPSLAHPFGTDNLGRDVFAGVVWGTRTAVMVGFISVAGANALGITIGASAGFFGGWLDQILVRVTELFIVIPRLFLAMALVAFFGATIWIIIITLALVTWPQVARLARAEFLTLRSREFVDAAIAAGSPDLRVIVRHMLPNILPTTIVNASLQISSAIILEAGLAFFGLGDPNRADWGAMLNSAQLQFRVAFWTALFPGLALTLTALGANLCGDALAELFSPRLHRSRRSHVQDTAPAPTIESTPSVAG